MKQKKRVGILTLYEKNYNFGALLQAYALQQTGALNALMVGDREHDIHGAKANGLDSVGVLYGYGSREELEAAGATYFAATAEDILKEAAQNFIWKREICGECYIAAWRRWAARPLLP